MKQFGRRHRPFFRVCVTDARNPQGGRVLEEVGTYDPMVPETDARTQLRGDRIDYWLGVGAQPSEKVAVLIKKYGTNGTHLEEQKSAVERLIAKRRRPSVPTDLPKMEKVVRKKKTAEAAPVNETEAASAPETQADSTPTDNAVTDGAITDGAITDGAITDGAITDDAITDGTAVENTAVETPAAENS